MRKRYLALLGLAVVTAALPALAWSGGVAEDRVVSWQAERDGLIVQCYAFGVDSADAGRAQGYDLCTNQPFPEDCVPIADEPGVDYRVLLDYPPDTPACGALWDEQDERHRRCETEQREAGVTDQEQIWRTCLND